MKGYGDKKRSYQETCDLFNATLAQEPISKLIVIRTVQRFMETGSVKDRSRNGRPTSASNDEKSATILQSFIETPTENEVSQSSICNILKKHRFFFHYYKMLYV